jgi:hypothetical protein
MAQMPDKLRDSLYEVMGEIGRQMVERARAYAPVRTGALRASIYARVTRELILYFGAYVQYAIYHEYGTRYIAPRYYLTRAFQECFPLLAFAWSEAVRQVWGRT